MLTVLLRLFSSDAFFYVRLRTCAQYASMNEFACSEHLKKRITGKQPLQSGLLSLSQQQ